MYSYLPTEIHAKPAASGVIATIDMFGVVHLRRAPAAPVSPPVADQSRRFAPRDAFSLLRALARRAGTPAQRQG